MWGAAGVGGRVGALRDLRIAWPGSTKPTSRLHRVDRVGGALPDRRTPSLKNSMGVRGGMGVGSVAGGGGKGGDGRGVFGFGSAGAREPKAKFGFLRRPVPTMSRGEGALEGVGCWTAPGMCTVSMGTDFGSVIHFGRTSPSLKATMHLSLHWGAMLNPSNARKQSPHACWARATQSKVSVVHVPRGNESAAKGSWACNVEDVIDPKLDDNNNRRRRPLWSTIESSVAN